MTYSDSSASPKLYRSRRGVFLGVCRGFAEYFDISPFWWRLLVVLMFIVTTGWPVVIAYIVAGIIMKPEPVLPCRTDADTEFYQSYARDRSMALHRLRRTFDDLRRRIERIETIVTARDYDWEKRLSQR